MSGSSVANVPKCPWLRVQFEGGAEPAPGTVDLKVAVGARGAFKKGNSDASSFSFRKSEACTFAWWRNQQRTCG